MRRSSALGRLLVACLTEHDWSRRLPEAERLAARLDPDEVAAAARFHGASGCVYRSLLPEEASPATAALVADYRGGVDRHLRALGDLARVARLFDQQGLRWVVMKGPVLAERAYARSDLRPYADLDLMVHGRDLGEALALAERAGGHLVDRNWPLLRRLGVGELLVRLHHGTLLDLHWHALNDRPTRQAFAVPVAELVERARVVALGSLAARALDPTDALLHLGLHGTLSGGNRLVWLKDVERSIAAEPPAWDDVVARGRAWGAGPPVALALARARAVLGADVPAGVPEALAQGRGWLALARTADRLSPPAQATGTRSPSRLVSRAARQDQPASLAELARNLGAALRESRWSATPRPADTDPASPASAQYPAGTAADRQAFLDAVVEEAG